MADPLERPQAGRVAVIAVHGIADQQRSDTGEAVALQLAAASGGRSVAQELPLAVPPLDPAVPYRRWRPEGWGGRGRKSLRQSWRSDFLDDAIGGLPSGAAQANSAAPHAAGADTGVRFTDYLLAKAQGARRHHAAQPTTVSVHAVDGPGLRADVFEMYWADLSRLPGSVASIVAELFTLLFHLSRLGVDALSLAERLAGRGELSALGRVQRAADWLYSRVLALLALQLVMCTLILAPALLFAAHANGTRVTATAIAAVGVAAALVWLKHWRWRAALPLGALIGAGVWTLLGTGSALFAVMLAWLAGLSLLYHRFLAFCEQRFRAVLGIGWMLYAVTLSCIALFGRSTGFAGSAGWINGTLGALEALLLAHAVLWPLLALLVAASVLLSEWALWRGDRAGRDHRQTLVTARLGLFSSVGAFLVLLMIGFMLSAWALRSMLGCALYEPWWFTGSPAAMCASDFLDWRAQRNASSFALVALFLLALLGFVALVFLPSILREMRLALPAAAGLGRWLSTGYRAIERLVRLWGLAVALGAAIVALLLLTSQIARSGVISYPAGLRCPPARHHRYGRAAVEELAEQHRHRHRRRCRRPDGPGQGGDQAAAGDPRAAGRCARRRQPLPRVPARCDLPRAHRRALRGAARPRSAPGLHARGDRRAQPGHGDHRRAAALPAAARAARPAGHRRRPGRPAGTARMDRRRRPSPAHRRQPAAPALRAALPGAVPLDAQPRATCRRHRLDGPAAARAGPASLGRTCGAAATMSDAGCGRQATTPVRRRCKWMRRATTARCSRAATARAAPGRTAASAPTRTPTTSSSSSASSPRSCSRWWAGRPQLAASPAKPAGKPLTAPSEARLPSAPMRERDDLQAARRHGEEAPAVGRHRQVGGAGVGPGHAGHRTGQLDAARAVDAVAADVARRRVARVGVAAVRRDRHPAGRTLRVRHRGADQRRHGRTFVEAVRRGGAARGFRDDQVVAAVEREAEGRGARRRGDDHRAQRAVAAHRVAEDSVGGLFGHPRSHRRRRRSRPVPAPCRSPPTGRASCRRSASAGPAACESPPRCRHRRH
jgi:hypothetical protein